jgi:hypothetical protein
MLHADPGGAVGAGGRGVHGAAVGVRTERTWLRRRVRRRCARPGSSRSIPDAIRSYAAVRGRQRVVNARGHLSNKPRQSPPPGNLS